MTPPIRERFACTVLAVRQAGSWQPGLASVGRGAPRGRGRSRGHGQRGRRDADAPALHLIGEAYRSPDGVAPRCRRPSGRSRRREPTVLRGSHPVQERTWHRPVPATGTAGRGGRGHDRRRGRRHERAAVRRPGAAGRFPAPRRPPAGLRARATRRDRCGRRAATTDPAVCAGAAPCCPWPSSTMAEAVTCVRSACSSNG